MNDTDGLAAETRRLLDAATEGDWDQVGATVEKEVDVGWCIVVAECDKVADAELIAAAPRLLANWLAREDRLADENRALREQLDAAQLRSIEARNPGIDMDEVRRTRGAGCPTCGSTDPNTLSSPCSWRQRHEADGWHDRGDA